MKASLVLALLAGLALASGQDCGCSAPNAKKWKAQCKKKACKKNCCECNKALCPSPPPAPPSAPPSCGPAKMCKFKSKKLKTKSCKKKGCKGCCECGGPCNPPPPSPPPQCTDTCKFKSKKMKKKSCKKMDCKGCCECGGECFPPPIAPSSPPPPSPSPSPPAPLAKPVETGSFNVQTLSSSNFHPQGMCYDSTAKALVLAQQGSGRKLVLVNPSTGSQIKTISTGLNYQTGVACAQNPQEYFVADYAGNTGGKDLYKVPTSGGASTVASETAAYGGYPMTMMGNTLIRGEITRSYSFAIKSIRFADRSNLNSITKTVDTTVSDGIGDMCYDGTRVWTMNYDSSLAGRRMDETDETVNADSSSRRRLGTGFTIHGLDASTYKLDTKYDATGNCPSGTIPAALACDASKMWLFCWKNGGTGKVLTFSV